MPTESTLDNPSVTDAASDVALVAPPDQPAGVVRDVPQTNRAGALSWDRSVYAKVAATLADRWLSAIRPVPWVADQHPGGHRHDDVRTLYRRVSVALAVGLYRELRPRGEDRDYLFEFVRCSLIRWQASLRTDGRPVSRNVRRDPLTGVIFAQVIRLLGETHEFQTSLLLDDVDRCAAWVAGRRPHTPWIESATVCALAEAAPLVRDSSLLKLARKRLEALLERQDEEGWFPERGGPDLGRLSLTIDSLARLHSQTGWTSLEKPLRRAVRFLARFVHFGGGIGGCCGSGSTALISPYGVELLAGGNADAAVLARHCRQRLATQPWESFFGHGDEASVTLGATLCLAAIHARADLSSVSEVPKSDHGWVEFPRAGLAIFTNEAYHAVVDYKRGGALQVTWRNGQPALSDPGVTICRSRKPRSRCDHIRSSTGQVSDNIVTCSGTMPVHISLVQRVRDAFSSASRRDRSAGAAARRTQRCELRPRHKRNERGNACAR
ncbi:MAG: hypothetical protein IH989_06305 [Planctomycetes bacterium]|nr:hypothetical protein [Planctomycetota bacterium]